MNLSEAKQKMMECDNVTELQAIEIDMVEHIGLLHKEKYMVDNPIEKTELLSKIALLGTMINICRERQDMVKKQIEEDMKTESHFNYNFHMAAKDVLLKPTYERICELAQRTRNQYKGMRAYIRSRKLE